MSEEEKIVVDLNGSRYDQSTFMGRLRHFLEVTDVRTLFTTNKKLEEAQTTLKEYEQQGCPPVPMERAEKLWEAKKTRDAMIHPDTKEKIFLPFRLSAYPPMNLFICVGLLTPNPSMSTVVFWQWMNQSYNIALNHANRNASNELSNSKILKTYAAAVGISCSVALGLGQVVKRSHSFSPAMRTSIQRFVPYTAVATAGIANVFMMRWNEMKEGVIVKDEDGNVLGKSKKAGFQALSQVAFSRCMACLPCLVFPPVIMGYLEQTSFLKRNPRLATPINLNVIAISLLVGLPVAVAIFPQYVKVRTSSLEDHFHNLKNEKGDRIEYAVFNRGLQRNQSALRQQ